MDRIKGGIPYYSQLKEKVMYFQFRIDELDDPNTINPNIYFGICRKNFKMTHNLSRNDHVWCMNLATGDIFNKRKWMDYYNIDQDNPELGHFCEGTLIGILLDMDRGYMNFYKDTHDMGQAFVTLELKYGDFHPFI